MSLRWPLAAVVLLLLSATSCGSDKSTAPRPAEITGLWTATKIQYVQVNSPNSIDFIALGGSASLLLDANASYRYVLAPQGSPPDTVTGAWDISQDGTLTLHQGPNSEWQFDSKLSGNTLQLDGADTEWDFDSDGVREPVKMHWVFTR
jgi:hypothetical protein